MSELINHRLADVEGRVVRLEDLANRSSANIALLSEHQERITEKLKEMAHDFKNEKINISELRKDYIERKAQEKVEDKIPIMTALGRAIVPVVLLAGTTFIGGVIINDVQVLKYISGGK